MRKRMWSALASIHFIFSNIDLPGTSSTPPVTTRPGSPQAWASTAVIRLEKRMLVLGCGCGPKLEVVGDFFGFLGCFLGYFGRFPVFLGFGGRGASLCSQ